MLIYSPATKADMDISLSVYDSDHMKNLVVMTNVVGTLVKYSGLARYENFLIEKWYTSEDRRRWVFEFKDNLQDETGEKLTAQGYVSILTKLLRVYKVNYTPPCFEALKGWSEFKDEASTISGLYSEGDKIIMEFTEVPSGLLEFLSMPYYGYYSEKNFDRDEWQDKSKIISTGQYTVKKLENGEFELSNRKRQSPVVNKGIDKVLIRYIDSKELLLFKDQIMVDVSEREIEKMDDLLEIRSTPNILRGIVLSPYKGIFRDSTIRAKFIEEFQKIKKHSTQNGLQEELTDNFYKVFDSLPTLNESSKVFSGEGIKKNETIEVFYRQKGNKYTDAMLGMIQRTAKVMNFNVKFTSQDEVKNYDRLETYSNKKYDVRVFGVDIGGAPENWVTEMMFNSSLGISFPDHNLRWKEHVKKYKNNEFKTEISYWNDFRNILNSDKTVVPIFQSGLRWFVSRGLKNDKFSQTMNLPRFDEISIEK